MFEEQRPGEMSGRFFVLELLQQVLFAHFLVQMVLNHQATLRTLVAALQNRLAEVETVQQRFCEV